MHIFPSSSGTGDKGQVTMIYTRMIQEVCEHMRESRATGHLRVAFIDGPINKKGHSKTDNKQPLSPQDFGQSFRSARLIFFANRGDNYNHKWRRNWIEGGCNHLKQNTNYVNSPRKRAQKNKNLRSTASIPPYL